MACRQVQYRLTGLVYTLVHWVSTHLLHHDGVVSLKCDIHVHVSLHGANFVGSQEALAPTALPAVLQDLHSAPCGSGLQATGQHMDGLAIMWVAFGCQFLSHIQGG